MQRRDPIFYYLVNFSGYRSHVKIRCKRGENASDSLACISLCIQITLHSRVYLFTLQQSPMLYQSHSHRIKQNTWLIQQSGQKVSNDWAIQKQLESKSQIQVSISGDSERNDQLLPKKGGYSTVWNFFRFKSDNNAQEVITWKQCFGTVTASQGNATNLYNLLQRHHKIQHELPMKDKGTTSENPSSRTGDQHFIMGYAESPVWTACFCIYLCAINVFEKMRIVWENRDLSSRGEISWFTFLQESCSPTNDY